MESLQTLLDQGSGWLNILFGDGGMPTTMQEYTRAAAILLTVSLVTGTITLVIKRGSLADALAWLISGCIFGIATIGDAPFWITVAMTSGLLAAYWLIRHFCTQLEKRASKH